MADATSQLRTRQEDSPPAGYTLLPLLRERETTPHAARSHGFTTLTSAALAMSTPPNGWTVSCGQRQWWAISPVVTTGWCKANCVAGNSACAASYCRSARRVCKPPPAAPSPFPLQPPIPPPRPASPSTPPPLPRPPLANVPWPPPSPPPPGAPCTEPLGAAYCSFQIGNCATVFCPACPLLGSCDFTRAASLDSHPACFEGMPAVSGTYFRLRAACTLSAPRRAKDAHCRAPTSFRVFHNQQVWFLRLAALTA